MMRIEFYKEILYNTKISFCHERSSTSWYDALYLFHFVYPFQDVSGIVWHLQFSHEIHKFDFPIRIQEG